MAKKEELQREIEKRRSVHYYEHGEEAYDFSIKVRRLDLPGLVYQNLSQDEIERAVQGYARDQISFLREELQARFPWISGTLVEGRSGGWLTIVTNKTVLYEEATQKEMKDRLEDLEEIKKSVQEAVRAYRETLERVSFWGLRKQDWSPRG